jgi:hypothetical protein
VPEHLRKACAEIEGGFFLGAVEALQPRLVQKITVEMPMMTPGVKTGDTVMR